MNRKEWETLVKSKYNLSKEKKDKTYYITIIDELYVLEGSIDGLEKRIKGAIKDRLEAVGKEWCDKQPILLSECSLVEEKEYGYYGDSDRDVIAVRASRNIKETDKEVLDRLINKEKAAASRKKAKLAVEKRERTMLKNLKEKYELEGKDV